MLSIAHASVMESPVSSDYFITTLQTVPEYTHGFQQQTFIGMQMRLIKVSEWLRSGLVICRLHVCGQARNFIRYLDITPSSGYGRMVSLFWQILPAAQTIPFGCFDRPRPEPFWSLNVYQYAGVRWHSPSAVINVGADRHEGFCCCSCSPSSFR